VLRRHPAKAEILTLVFFDPLRITIHDQVELDIVLEERLEAASTSEKP
jgi:hypothetical protein